MDSLQLEMSGLMKELHCPYEEEVSGLLKGATRNTNDHLKFVCTSALPIFIILTVLTARNPNIFTLLFSLFSVSQLGAPGGSAPEEQTRH